MKKIYEAPRLEIEVYELNAAIAANCQTKISMGPAYGSYTACDEFDFGGFGVMAASYDTSFYKLEDHGGNVCTCYYASGGEGYFTS